MDIRPILSAMLRNRAGLVLVGLQIALTLAVATNAAFIIDQRMSKIGRPSGIDAANIFYISSYGYSPTYDERATLVNDMAVLRAMPGVVAASSVNSIPMSEGGSSNTYQASADPKAAKITGNYFEISEQGLKAFGINLVEGRNFRPDEMTYSGISNLFVKQVIISRNMAKAVFGDEHAVGKLVYDGTGAAAQVIGVSENMLGSWVNAKTPENIVFHPMLQTGHRLLYLVRTEPGRRDELIAAAERSLQKPGDGRFIVWVRSQDHYTEASYRADHRMVVFLWTLIILMVSVTALGIVGLATFLVNARRKQIGTRRAIGARRIDILKYFMVENGLLTGFGVLLGTGLSFLFSYWLSNMFALPPLKSSFVGWGVCALLILGQLAVYLPARRAAAVPPAVATRTV